MRDAHQTIAETSGAPVPTVPMYRYIGIDCGVVVGNWRYASWAVIESQLQQFVGVNGTRVSPSTALLAAGQAAGDSGEADRAWRVQCRASISVNGPWSFWYKGIFLVFLVCAVY